MSVSQRTRSLQARFDAIVDEAPDEVLSALERAVTKAEKVLLPRRARGRPNKLRIVLADLLVNVKLQHLLAGNRLTDKEAIERLVDVAQPRAQPQRKRQLILQWRQRLAAARKKSRR